jgi:hypothetical protein
VSQVLSRWCLSLRDCKIMDAGAATLEGGLRSWLYGGQRGGVGGPSLRSWGWRGAGGGGSWCWRRFSFGNPRSCLGCPTWGQRTGEFSGAVCGCFGTKAQHPAPNDSDACGCRNPLGGVVMGIRSAVRLRVKALDLAVSTATVHCVVFPLGGVGVEPCFDSVSCQCLRGNFGFSVFFFFVFL